MERLEACYFCGTADDAPLNEVTIAPRSRRDDPDATVQVTLCPSCEAKLERVLRGLFERVESRRDEAAAEDDEAGAGEGPPAEPVDRIDVSAADAGDDPSSPQGRRHLFTDPLAADAEAGPSGEGDATDDGEDVEADATAGAAADGADEDAEIIEEEPRARARATSGTEPSLDGVSVGEYNRVMRLLQNRSFPIDRGAFVDLAASAYDLGEDSVEAVLDAVIDEGALAEREGQLDRPGGDAP